MKTTSICLALLSAAIAAAAQEFGGSVAPFLDRDTANTPSAAGAPVPSAADRQAARPDASVKSACSRTKTVRQAIEAAAKKRCGEITASDLAAITELTATVDDYRDRWRWTGPGLKLKEDDLQGLTSLKSISLSNTAAVIETLPAGIFQGLPSLQKIDLSNSLSLKNAPAGLFQGLSSLQTLNLASSNLGTLPAGIFQGLSSLENLSLENVSVDGLSADIFQGLSSLQTLNLNGVKRTNDAGYQFAGSFHGLSSLQHLNLSHNGIVRLPAGLFQGLSSLQDLDLSANSLDFSQMPADIFQGLSSLRTLDLSRNAEFWGQNYTRSPGVWPAGIFKGLSSLQTLDASADELQLSIQNINELGLSPSVKLIF